MRALKLANRHKRWRKRYLWFSPGMIATASLLLVVAPGTTEFYYAHLVPNLFTITLAFLNEALFTASGEKIFSEDG